MINSVTKLLYPPRGLPRTATPAAAQKCAALPLRFLSFRRSLSNSCILVVHDDQAIVNAIAILLEREGYQVLRAYDGRQALEMENASQIPHQQIDDFQLGSSQMHRLSVHQKHLLYGPLYGRGRLCDQALQP